MYEIAAIPTKYNSVQFRSRLEARWAAFFDLCKWRWDYEPFDLKGWAPDFKIKTPFVDVLAEVKPVEIEVDRSHRKHFQKAINHQSAMQVLLLGMAPRDCGSYNVGDLLDRPADATYLPVPIWDHFNVREAPELWREAGNAVQWHPQH